MKIADYWAIVERIKIIEDYINTAYISEARKERIKQLLEEILDVAKTSR